MIGIWVQRSQGLAPECKRVLPTKTKRLGR